MALFSFSINHYTVFLQNVIKGGIDKENSQDYFTFILGHRRGLMVIAAGWRSEGRGFKSLQGFNPDTSGNLYPGLTQNAQKNKIIRFPART